MARAPPTNLADFFRSSVWFWERENFSSDDDSSPVCPTFLQKFRYQLYARPLPFAGTYYVLRFSIVKGKLIRTYKQIVVTATSSLRIIRIFGEPDVFLSRRISSPTPTQLLTYCMHLYFLPQIRITERRCGAWKLEYEKARYGGPFLFRRPY